MKKINVFAFGLLVLFALVLFACGNKPEPKEEVEFTFDVSESMKAGESQDIVLNIVKGDEAKIKEAVIYESDDESVLKIEDGKIVAIEGGIATVSATYNDYSAEVIIIVKKMRAISFELNGGTCPNLPSEVSADEKYTLPIPTKEGYIFMGWYSNKTLNGILVTELNSMNTTITTVYAAWKSEKHVITYHILDGDKETTFTDESKFEEDFTLSTPEYDANEYVFSGWYKERNLYQPISSIEAGFESDTDVYGALVKKGTEFKITLIASGGQTSNGKYEYTYKVGESLTLPTGRKTKYTFIGWYKDMYFNYPIETKFYKDSTIYAKFSENAPVEAINITTTDTELQRQQTLQIKFSLFPASPTVRTVTYVSSNPSVATVDANGLITGVGIGMVTISIISDSETKATSTIELEIFEPDFFEVSYETTSAVLVGESIKLNAKYHLRGASEVPVSFESADTSIATVDKDGNVTGVKAGNTTIKVYVTADSTKYFNYGITVYDSTASDIVKFLINANNANVFVRPNLGIGAGNPEYYMDIIGSISKLFFNNTYSVNTKYEATQKGVSSNHGEPMESVEFITVHYTGNMAAGATAAANANYFAGGGGGTSIHYVTGNDGIFHVLDNTLVGFHAGDGHSADTKSEWYPTGVFHKDTDPEQPVWGINENAHFTLNGEETIIKVPEETTHNRGFVTEDKWMNDMGYGFYIDPNTNEYYMNKVWWCYTQISEGRICNHGGNMNSIGIESAVNKGSDLWYTWHLTAELVAHLMIDQNLPITRVVGHHFFSAKACPQPMLENDLEIWYEFVELVRAEHEMLTTFKGYTISMEVVEGANNVSTNGRVTQDSDYHNITYKLTITTPDKKTETVTVSSIISSSLMN